MPPLGVDAHFSFVVIGCGSRGRTYAKIALQLGHRLAAIAEPDPVACAAVTAMVSTAPLRTYATGEERLLEKRLADLAVISTQDADHFRQAAAALRCGYHVLLEKPAAQSAEEVEELGRLARAHERKLIHCFVLRYPPLLPHAETLHRRGWHW
jgi:predicted dehydrogenase